MERINTSDDVFQRWLERERLRREDGSGSRHVRAAQLVAAALANKGCVPRVDSEFAARSKI